MVTCRFVGSDTSTVGDREFTSVGDLAMFSERTFAEAVMGGCILIPDDTFRRIGFSSVELEEFGHDSIGAPESFMLKLRIAQQAYRDLRSRLSSGHEISQVTSEATSVEDVENAQIAG